MAGEFSGPSLKREERAEHLHLLDEFGRRILRPFIEAARRCSALARSPAFGRRILRPFIEAVRATNSASQLRSVWPENSPALH